MGLTMLNIVIPVKPLAAGKSRLAPVLDAAARADLCRWMLLRTLQLGAPLGRVLVVSEDPEVASIVARLPYRHLACLAPKVTGDLNAALNEGRERLPAADALLVLPIDLVFLQADTLRRVCRRPERIVIAPDGRGQGTNLLHLPAALAPGFRFCFGPDSFAQHRAEALRLGCEPRIVHAPDAAFDLDLPGDLQRAMRHDRWTYQLGGRPGAEPLLTIKSAAAF